MEGFFSKFDNFFRQIGTQFWLGKFIFRIRSASKATPKQAPAFLTDLSKILEPDFDSLFQLFSDKRQKVRHRLCDAVFAQPVKDHDKDQEENRVLDDLPKIAPRWLARWPIGQFHFLNNSLDKIHNSTIFDKIKNLSLTFWQTCQKSFDSPCLIPRLAGFLVQGVFATGLAKFLNFDAFIFGVARQIQGVISRTANRARQSSFF